MMPAMAFARSIPTPRNTLTAWHSRTTATAAHPGRFHRRASMHHAADLHLRCARRLEALTTPELHTSGDLRTAAISARAAATTSPSLNCRAAQLTPWPAAAASTRRRSRRRVALPPPSSRAAQTSGSRLQRRRGEEAMGEGGGGGGGWAVASASRLMWGQRGAVWPVIWILPQHTVYS